MANFKQMPLKYCLTLAQVTDLCIMCLFYEKNSNMAPLCTCNIFVTSSFTPANEFLFWISFFSLGFFYVTPLSFIGPAGQLDSCVSCTKETKWSWGQAVMSNSSYSVTYRPAAVFGSLMETMDGFERSGALWSPSLIEFPGSRLQRWGWLWSGICRSRKGRTVGAWGPSSVLTFYKQVGWSGRGWQWRRRRKEKREKPIVALCECRGGT